ncbi:di-trans,poly-cis-decaprenylcistransferase [Rhinocladiella mackenziei CBS 650.93]|uniref:Di-trans,poly-cis-decaprenylcistransferase n=1 Tax=Rhinocladiella mackenziei CBS 650.93 TaxID=1442369 RepID=A0A0D2H431_9EURO|nr:di-trans,poly-cis-decaprenylcistransferase [Rhinocladiella mackenziei CBS 650.93]KIX05168.1 di-trans,poly-cis-decaprenylcistransferase [Rhinocladiella mackenziei CBS 650.93]
MTSRHMSHVSRWLLSSPPAEWALNQLRELLIGALRHGPVPQHVAFVMDGNRRFAKNHRIETVEGHNLGFEALAKILEVCYKSGVTHVTIYAFSIENFKRSKYEVDALMDMAKIKLKQLTQHGDLLDRYGARIRILGQRELIKPDVLEAMDRAVEMTSQNGNCVLNVCFPYTSREEITSAIRDTVEEYSRPIVPANGPDNERRSPFREERITNTIRSQQFSEHTATSSGSTMYLQLPGSDLQSPSSSTTSLSSYSADPSDPSEHDHETSSVSTSTTLHQDDPLMTSSLLDQKPTATSASPLTTSTIRLQPQYRSPELITPATLNSHMYTASDPSIDLLIRTSGVSRLSDFMLWQCHEDTQIVFLDVLWPDFDLWSFLPVLWEWQWRVRKVAKEAGQEDDLDVELSKSAKSTKASARVGSGAGNKTHKTAAKHAETQRPAKAHAS